MTQAAQLAQYGSNNVGLSFKNRLINSDMSIAQRSAGPVTNSVSASGLVYDVVDRWGYWAQEASKFTTTQSTTAPAGFSNSALITSSTALSVVSGAYYTFSQRIEGFNFADLGFGTANAQSFTVSFWVRSSITGTFPFYCFNSGYSRSYASTFTVNAVNTWEQKTITIAGDTTGTWVGSTNGIGIEVGITLAAGSNWFSPAANAWSSTSFGLGLTGATNFLATNGATMNVTGFQLEKGSVATSFDYLPYGTELMLCQRYYFLLASGGGKQISMGAYYNSTYLTTATILPVVMRTTPSLVQTSGTNYYGIYANSTLDTFNSFASIADGSNQSVGLNIDTNISGTSGACGRIVTNDASAYLAFSAEL